MKAIAAFSMTTSTDLIIERTVDTNKGEPENQRNRAKGTAKCAGDKWESCGLNSQSTEKRKSDVDKANVPILFCSINVKQMRRHLLKLDE